MESTPADNTIYKFEVVKELMLVELSMIYQRKDYISYACDTSQNPTSQYRNMEHQEVFQVSE